MNSKNELSTEYFEKVLHEEFPEIEICKDEPLTTENMESAVYKLDERWQEPPQPDNYII